MILYQKEKRSKIFQVKTISKDVRKTIVPSFVFLFNLSKSVFLIFVFYRKWKVKNIVVLDVRSAAHFEAFFNQARLAFFRTSLMFYVGRGVRVRLHASYAKACVNWNYDVTKTKNYISQNRCVISILIMLEIINRTLTEAI